MSSPEYAHENVTGALDSLVRALPIQRRLVGAGLALMLIEANMLPDDHARTLWGSIMERLTALEPVGGEGSIDRSCSEMSDEQAEAVARDVVRLASHLWFAAASGAA